MNPGSNPSGSLSQELAIFTRVQELAAQVQAEVSASNYEYNGRNDFWREVARRLYGIPYEEVTPEQRNFAKREGFIFLYSSGPHKFKAPWQAHPILPERKG